MSATAILTLMLGMGGTTAMFSLLDALLIRHLPVENPGELVRLAERRNDGGPIEAFTLVTHDMLQRGSKTLAGVIASSMPNGRPAEIKVGDERRSAYVQLVSDNYFDVLGVRALRGRVFHQPEAATSTSSATSATSTTSAAPAASGASEEPAAVISEEYWRRQYHSDPSVLGRRFRHGKHDFTIAGIAARGFRGTEVDSPADIWIRTAQAVPANSQDRTRGRGTRVMGRLRPGVTRIQAEAEASLLLGRPVRVQPGGNGHSGLRERLYQPLVLVALAAGLVLLIACANLAT